MTGFTDKLKDLAGKQHKTSSSKKTESHSESHVSTTTAAHPTLLGSSGQHQVIGGEHGGSAFGSSHTSASTHPQAPPSIAPSSGGIGDGFEHVPAPQQQLHSPAQVTPSAPTNPQLSPRLPTDSHTSGPALHPTSQLASGSPGVLYETSGANSKSTAPATAVTHPTSVQEPTAAPTFESRVHEPKSTSTIEAQEQKTLPTFRSGAQEPTAVAAAISPEISSKLAGSSSSPGGPTYEPIKEHIGSSVGQQKSSHPSVTEGGLGSTGTARPGGNRVTEADKASIGGGGVNTSTVPTNTNTPTTNINTPTTGVAGSQPQGYVQQAQATAAPYIAQAQETAAPYVAKAQETVGPYVAKAQETVGPYVAQAQETVGPYVSQAQDAASPYVAKARDLGSSAIESARPVVAQAANSAGQAASSAYNTAAAELDARGVNLETTKQKLADVGQTAKDYGAVGQQRAGEYLQQAVDQAKNMDGENKSIVASIFGTVVLVWLAFGFSLVAMLALGVAGSIAALLARFSSKRVSGKGNTPAEVEGRTSTPTKQTQTSTPTKHTQTAAPGLAAAARQTQTSGVETHFPKPAHPDNSLNSGTTPASSLI